MYTTTNQLYSLLAKRLREEVIPNEYYSGSIELSYGNVDCELQLSAVIYYDKCKAPDGSYLVVSDIIPVWWEFHTYNHRGRERLNDFDFKLFKEFVID